MTEKTREELMVHAENEFRLVIMASKRARQLNEGARAVVENKSSQPTVTALREIAAGKVRIKRKE